VKSGHQYSFTFILARIVQFHVRRHLFYEFLFVYLFFLLDNDVIVTLQYFVDALLIHFSYEDKRLT